MSIKNFKNPWDVGGPLHPDWLGGEKALGGDVLPEKNNEQRQNKEVIPFRLFLYGGSVDEDELLFRAMNNTKDDYNDSLLQAVFQIESAQTITRTIRASLKNTIQSLDLFSHGGPIKLYFKRGADNKDNDLYRYESDMGDNNRESDHLQNIKYEAFTDGAKVEFHGCNTGMIEEVDTFARVFSVGLKLFGKKNAVVISHGDYANPDQHKTLKGDDYRHGLRRIYNGGETLFLTREEGRISADTINYYLRKKAAAINQGIPYNGENEKTWRG